MKSIRLLVTGFILIIVGAMVCAASFVLMGFDPRSLNTASYMTNTYDADAVFDKIAVNGDTEKISFVLSDDGKCRVVCKELENTRHEVKVDGDTLCIDNISGNVFFIGFLSESPEMTVYLPKNSYSSLDLDSDTSDVSIPEEFSFSDINIKLDTGDLLCYAGADGDVSVKTDTGEITVQGMNPRSLTVSTHTGYTILNDISCSGKTDISVQTANVEMNGINCAEFSSKGSTGKLLMTDVVTTGSWDIKRDTGDISFVNCDAEYINIKTSTGDVAGSLLSDKIFNVSTDTGKTDVPGSKGDQECSIRTDTGDISVSIR